MDKRTEEEDEEQKECVDGRSLARSRYIVRALAPKRRHRRRGVWGEFKAAPLPLPLLHYSLRAWPGQSGGPAPFRLQPTAACTARARGLLSV